MGATQVVPSLRLAELFEAWPETMSVFVRQRMACVGCVMSVFDTIRVAAANYKLDLAAFLEEIRDAGDRRTAVRPGEEA